MVKKQTAVQFLLAQIESNLAIGYNSITKQQHEQAEQMFREQIQEAFVAGDERGKNDIPFNAEQYYTQTFNL